MIQNIDSDLEEQLKQLELPYKSRGEAQVGRLLDRYGVPFFYEHPTLIYDRGHHRVWHPDFSLPDYNGMIIEYAGMPDVPDYMDGIRHKESTYQANGIPALFVYPQDLAGPNWPERLYERIQKTGDQALQIQGYAIRGSTDQSYSHPQ